jgi:hypothetical protein
MLVATIPSWLTSTLAGEHEGEGQVQARAVFVGEDGKVMMLDADPSVGKEMEVHAIVLGGEEGAADLAKAKKMKVIARTKAGTVKEGGWLGVSIGQVPEALVDQLDLNGHGVMILNVVKGGPAEVAGLKAHDVIMSFDGDEASNDIHKLVELVGAHKPGDEVDVVVLRDGEENIFTVELASRADMNEFVWVHKGDPLAEVEERIVTRGKVMRKGPNEEWIFEDLGDLSELSDLSEKIKVLIPKAGTQSTKVYLDGNRKSILTKIVKDGDVLVVEQEDEGEITVTRTDKDGQETTTVYGDMDELAEGDPEAFELFNESGGGAIVHLDLEGLADLDLDFDFDMEALTEEATEWRTELQERLSEASEAYHASMEEAHEALREALEQWEEQGWDGRSEPWSQFMKKPPMHQKGAPFFTHEGLVQLGKPRHSFTVKEDGSIDVRIRKGDSELVRVFSGERDLAERSPELYEKYQALIEVEEEAD